MDNYVERNKYLKDGAREEISEQYLQLGKVYLEFDLQKAQEMFQNAASQTNFHIYYDNTRSLINRTLKKSLELLKRYYQERKLHCKENFETWVLLEGYNELFNEYPILFRIVYDLIESEVKNLKECIDRISNDRNIFIFDNVLRLF